VEILAPLRGAECQWTTIQGLRSFHSLNPWLFSCHASGVPLLFLLLVFGILRIFKNVL
jgi:hypothetical protein